MRKIIAGLAPRNLVLASGSPHDTRSLASSVASELTPQRTAVHVPACGQTLDLPLPPAYRIALADGLVKDLKSNVVKAADGAEYTLAWAAGTLQPHLLSAQVMYCSFFWLYYDIF